MCIGFAPSYVFELKELAMPQARSGSGSSGSTSRSKKSSSRKSSAKKTSSSSRAKSSRSTTRKSSSGRSTARKPSGASRVKSAADDARIEAVANRLRKLNERIIEAGREAGETTLTSYEKALKAIASGIEKGPGSSDIDWISNLATAQAKFIRDVTSSWTSAARNALK
jgi:hypothetical protein